MGARRAASRGRDPSTVRPSELGAGFWGLLFGLVFFVPLLGAAIGATTGALAGALADVGIDDHFINRVRDQVTPGTSALFLLTSDAVVGRVTDASGRARAPTLIVDRPRRPTRRPRCARSSETERPADPATPIAGGPTREGAGPG